MKRCGDSLPYIHVARDDSSVDGSVNRGVVQIRLRHGDCRFLLFYLGCGLNHLSLCRANGRLRAFGIGLRQVELLLAHYTFFGQPLRALIVSFRLDSSCSGFLGIGFGGCQICLRIAKVCFGLQQRTFEQRRIDLRDDLSLLDAGIEVGGKMRNGAGNLRAYLHGGDGVNRARGLHDVANVAAIDFGRKVLRLIASLEFEGSK